MTNLDFNKLKKAIENEDNYVDMGEDLTINEFKTFTYLAFDEKTNKLHIPNKQYTISTKTNPKTLSFIEARAFLSSDHKTTNNGAVSIYSFYFDCSLTKNNHKGYEFYHEQPVKAKKSEIYQINRNYHFVIYDDAVKEIKFADIKNQINILSKDFSKMKFDGIWSQFYSGYDNIEFDITKPTIDYPHSFDIAFITPATKSIKIDNSRPVISCIGLRMYSKKATADHIKCKALLKAIPENNFTEFSKDQYSYIFLVGKSLVK